VTGPGARRRCRHPGKDKRRLMGDHAASLTEQLELFVDAESHFGAATGLTLSKPAASHLPGSFLHVILLHC